MKVGIVTFHRAHNYGAVLQCYALQEYLKSKGHDVYVVDYIDSLLLKYYEIFNIDRFRTKNPISLFKRISKEIKLFPSRLRRRNVFRNFLNERLNLLPFNEISDIDLFIVGSDQVWNTRLTKGFTPVYWGNFCHKNGAVIISYAASIEQFWSTDSDSSVADLLSNFQAISVREHDALNRISKITNRPITQSVDPTLLLDYRQWKTISKSPIIEEPYLLYYQVRPSKKGYALAKKTAQEKGLRLVCLSASIEDYSSPICACPTLEEYLGWFRCASYVVCSSFHGTVFSILFRRPFISLRLDDGQNSRVESLLSLFDMLENYGDSMIESPKILSEKELAEKLENVSRMSKEYLSAHL